MSRIEDVLRKLRTEGTAASPAVGTAANPVPPRPPVPRRVDAAPGGPSAGPQLKKRKAVHDGEKFHVAQESLIEGGVLAPLDKAFATADEFRRIKRPLIANALREGDDAMPMQNVIMITSALPGAGKTFCSVNLAVSMSLERELNVLLVDADVAKPHITRAFGLSNVPGLIDLLLDDTASVEDVLVRTDLNDIQVLPAGRSHPQATELLSSERMSVIMNELATRYVDRIVLVDSPPMLLTSEAHALAGQVGQITLVVEAGRTTRQALEQTLEALDPDKAINLLLNKTRRWSGSHYYGEYGYYGHENR